MENTNRLVTGSLIQLSCAWFSGGWLLFSCMANTKLVHNFLFNLQMLVVGGVCASQPGGQAQWRYASVISSAALDATTDLGSSMQIIQIATAKRTITLIGNTMCVCLWHWRVSTGNTQACQTVFQPEACCVWLVDVKGGEYHPPRVY